MEEEVIISGMAFDMPSDNYEEFEHEIDSEKLGNKLVQVNKQKGSVREYQFYAARYLLLNFIAKKNAPAKKFRVNLACLSSDPEHYKFIDWRWLYAALASAAVSGLCVFLAQRDIVRVEYCAVVGGIALTAMVVNILIFIYRMRNEFIFTSRFGGIKLFILENKKPEQKAFDDFFVSLQQAIDRAVSARTVEDRLVEELKMCRRLRDEKVIDDRTYTVARTAIFKHEKYKA